MKWILILILCLHTLNAEENASPTMIRRGYYHLPQTCDCPSRILRSYHFFSRCFRDFVEEEYPEQFRDNDNYSSRDQYHYYLGMKDAYKNILDDLGWELQDPKN